MGERRKIDSRPHRAVIVAADHLFATPSEKGLSAPIGESWDPDQHRSPAEFDCIDHLQRGLFAADRVERRVYTEAVRHLSHAFDHIPRQQQGCRSLDMLDFT